MTTDNKLAKSIGLLFIATMFLGMIDAYMVAPLLDAPLSDYELHASRFYLGAFAILFMALGVVGIALLFYPILERHSRTVAMVYLSARVMECLLLLIGVVAYFLLLTLSQTFISAGSPDGSNFRTIADLIIEARYSGYQVAMIILGIASTLLCYVLYKFRLIHRLIAVVGIVAYLLVTVSAVLDLLGLIDTTGAGGLLYIPGALFELFLLPGWLIVRGFNPVAGRFGVQGE